MAGYKWQGGSAGGFVRPGSRRIMTQADRERGHRLYTQLQHSPFWCDNCGCMHPLREHRQCREEHPYRSAYRGMT